MNTAFPIAAVVLLLPLGCGSGAASPSAGSGGGAGSLGGGGAGGAGNSGGSSGLEGFFIAADIDGRTRVSTHNITPSGPGAILQWATAEVSPESSEWYFNIQQLPVPLLPSHTAACASGNNYLDFRDREVTPQRWFASRPTSTCAVTFVAPAQAGTLEGTFTATLRLVGTSTDYPVTNGHFRLPFAP